MSTIQSTVAVRDGLILSLDAANKESYDPDIGGTLWYDTSGNGNHFYLYNTPTYDSGSIKSFNFDGVNEYGYWIGPFGYNTNKDYIFNRFIGTNTNLNTSPSSNRTIEIWFKANGTSPYAIPYNWGSLFGERFNTSGLIYLEPGNLLRWKWDDSVGGLIQKQIQTGEWLQIVVCLKNSYYFTYYVNGLLDTPEQRSTDLAASSNIAWAIATEVRNYYYLACNVAIIRMYNRVLSPEEIFQNFNSNRTRFGL